MKPHHETQREFAQRLRDLGITKPRGNPPKKERTKIMKSFIISIPVEQDRLGEVVAALADVTTAYDIKAVETVPYWKNKKKGKAKVVRAKRKNYNPFPTGTMRLGPKPKNANGEGPSDILRRLVKDGDKLGNLFTAADIRAALDNENMSVQNIHSVIGALVKSGDIKKLQQGRYGKVMN